MSLKIDRAELEVVIKNDKARQKMMQLEDEMRKTNTLMKKAKKVFGETSDEFKNQQARLKELQQEYDKVVESVGLTNLSVKELAKRSKELNQILRNLNPNSKEYIIYDKQLEQVNNRLKELKGTAKSTQLSFGKLADGFNRYAGMAASAIAAFTGLSLTAHKCTKEFDEMSEAESQVIKYTGMARENMRELNDEFKHMDTRTSREKLNALAADAGRLGKQSKEDVLEFVEAGNMINVALGEDLGDDAVKNIGKLSDIFNDGSRSMKDSMLAIGSAINHVAQNSSAAEQYLVEFTARMGGTGKQAKMSVTDIMGFASALDQNMLRSEMASTALQKLIMNMYKEPVKYAELAGIKVHEFTELVKNDANEAVLTFLEALGKLGGMDALSPVLAEMKLEGAEAAGVIASLAANVDKVRKEQDGANMAFIEGTSILEEYNVQNNTEQAGTEKMLKLLKEKRIELGEKLKPIMKYMISTGTMTIKMLLQATAAFTKYGTAISLVSAFIGTYTLAVKASSIATALHTARTKAAAAATMFFNNVIKANPFAAALSVLTTLTIGLFHFIKTTDKAAASQKKLNDEIKNLSEDEATRIKSIKARANNLNMLNERQLKQLRADAEAEKNILQDRLTNQEVMYKDEYNLRKKNLMDRKDINDTTKRVVMQSVDNKLKDQMATLDVLRGEMNALQDILDKLPKAKESNGNIFTTPKATISDSDKKTLKISNGMESDIALLENQRALNLIKEEDYQKKLYDIKVRYLAQRIDLLKEEGKSTADAELEMLELMTQESNRLYMNKKSGSKNGKEFSATSIIEEEDPEEDTYILDKFKNSQDGKLALLEAFHEAGLISEEEYQDKITEMNRQKEEERAAIRTASLQTVADLAGSLSQLMGAMQDGEIQKVSRKYDKQIKEAKKAGKDTTKLEEEKEAEIAAIKKKYADKQFAMAVLQITATTAITAMEAYKAMAGIPVVGPALGAAAAAAAVIAGAAQIAVAKQQRDEAKGLYSGGYSEGYTSSGNSHEVAGVIPVHKNEFVTNHEGVANPHVRQFLDVFDMAQKNGTIGMLNTTQILERVKFVGGKYDGGYSDDPQTASLPSGDFSIILRQILDAVRNNSEYLSAISNKDLKIDVRAVRDGITQVERLERNARR